MLRAPRGSHRVRRLGLGAAALALVLLVAGCGGAEPEQAQSGDAGPTALRIAFVPATTGLALQVAQTQGFFERNDLAVTLTEATNISDIPPALGRQYDITLGTATDLIRAGDAGLDVVQISGNTVSTAQNPFVQLIVPADSGITGVGQLGGTTVGSPTLSGVIHAAVLYWAQQNGVDPASINGVQVPPPNLPDQLAAGQVDAVEALEPFATQLRNRGNVSLGDPFSPIADPLATNFWMAQGAWAEDNREVVARFVEALNQATGFIEQNPEQARQVLQGYTGMPPQVAATVPLPTFSTEIRTEDLATWERVLTEIGQFQGDVDPNELVLSGT
jgi:NitT/TauT family transport system substrate-binding protein